MEADLGHDVASLGTISERARFEAVRRRVFQEMKDAGSRWRLILLLPYQFIVVIVLAVCGDSPRRVGIQIAAFAVSAFAVNYAESRHSAAKLRPRERRSRCPDGRLALFVTCLCMLVSIGNTGGLASPLLLSCVPFVMAVSLNPLLGNKRGFIIHMLVLGFIVLAAASRTVIGELAPPLAPDVRWASTEYVSLALASVMVSFVAVYKISRAITNAHERVALELAARREELCDESAGRTRVLEGMAARLAHEVKNPLAAIKGLSTHVARNAEDPKVKERLAIVAAETERLQEIVDGFLSFSRGLDDLRVAEAKPFEIARELSLLLETRAADAGVALEVRGSRELTLQADGKKLRQALLNLVLNAMQASPVGATVTVEIAKSCKDGAAVLKIIDRGAGMAPEVLERIRRPYFTTKETGSGLGIAVARGIIEQHGGTLRFESAPGRGTTATIGLPARACGRGKAKLPMPGCGAFAGAIESAELPALEPEKVPS